MVDLPAPGRAGDEDEPARAVQGPHERDGQAELVRAREADRGVARRDSAALAPLVEGVAPHPPLVRPGEREVDRAVLLEGVPVVGAEQLIDELSS